MSPKVQSGQDHGGGDKGIRANPWRLSKGRGRSPEEESSEETNE